LSNSIDPKFTAQADYDNGTFEGILPQGPALYMSDIGHTDNSLNTQLPIDDRVEEVPLPKALKGLGESVIRETLVEAGLSYPRELVIAAKQLVANELKLANIIHDKIFVESEFTDGITIATNITGKGGKKRIEVPVEIANDKVLMPSGFTSGAMAGPFTEDSLKSFANKVDGADFYLTNMI
jgi:hypothetical protein